MITRFGFKLSKDSAKKTVAVQAFSDAGTLAALAAAQNDTNHFTTWFGGGIPGGAATVATYAGRMSTFLSSTGITITLEVGSPEGAAGGSFAACDAEKYR